MKKLVVLLIVACSLVWAGVAQAWHANDVTVTAVCNVQYGWYDVTAVIVQSSQWPGATLKSVTPTTYPGNTSGQKPVTIVVKWSNGETQTFLKTVTLAGTCTKVCEPVTVYVDREVTRTVYVDREVEKRVEVPVEKVVEKIVYVPKIVVKWKIKKVYSIKWKVKWKVKKVTKVIHDRCVPPPPDGCVGKCYPPYTTGSG